MRASMSAVRDRVCGKGSRWPVVAAIALMTLIGNRGAMAQTLKEPSLEALFVGEQWPELEKQALARLAVRPDDAQAVLALSLAAISTEGASGSARRQAAIARAQACLEKDSRIAECHYGLGVTLGIEAMSQGMMKALGSVSTIRESLQQAHVLAPAWYGARSALLEFYLQAPGLAGGSRSKAAELARTAATPAQQRVLQARVMATEEQELPALRLLSEHRFGVDAAVDDDARSFGDGAVFGLLNKAASLSADERAAALTATRAWYERLLKERPESAVAHYGLGRTQAEAGQHAEAVAAYERSARGKGAANLPIDYRMGISLQALGRKEAARTALQRFTSAGKGSKRALDDARKRLGELGA